MSGERFTGYLACTGENRRFRLENQMVRAIPLGPLGKVQKIIYRLICGDAFFLIFLGFSAHLDVTFVPSHSPTMSNFIVLCL